MLTIFPEMLGVRVLLLVFVLCLTASCCWCHEALGDLPLNGNSIVLSMLERKPKVNIVSFEPLGEDIALGLDFLLPFLKVPIVREIDVYGNEPALININSAALVSTGILAASSALVSYLFRSYIVFDPLGKSENMEKTHRLDNNYEHDLWSMLNNVIVIYKNSTGEKADTSLTGLLTTLDETYHHKGLDISSCLQKALCQRLQQPSEYRQYDTRDTSSGLEKIIDGVTSLQWVRENILRYTSLSDVLAEESDAMNRQLHRLSCDQKFPKCRLLLNTDNIGSLFAAYLKFT